MPDCLRQCETLAQATDLALIAIGRVDSSDMRIRARRAGAADHVVWPVEPAELLARVEAVLRLVEKGTRQGHRREIAPGIELDLSRQVVVVQGQDRPLSATEFKLLQHLAERPGRIFSREDLLDAVWGWDQAIGAREVDVYISYLRQKIEETPRAPRHIITVRGIGYRFERRRTE